MIEDIGPGATDFICGNAEIVMKKWPIDHVRNIELYDNLFDLNTTYGFVSTNFSVIILNALGALECKREELDRPLGEVLHGLDIF